MKLRASWLCISGFLLALATFASPAHAQATRTWVSGVGDDANPCSRTAPCKTFAGAISKTAAGGEINCIDPGGFGAVTIVKAMTIDCTNVEAGVVVAGTNGVIVNAGVNDVVVLRGIDFMGTVAVPGLNGVRFIAGGALHIEKCLIREFTSAPPNGNGVLFQPSGASKLFISDTVLTNNSGGGVLIKPTGAGLSKVAIVRTIASGNSNGITADTSTPATGAINMTVRDTDVSANVTNGFAAITVAGSGPVAVAVDNSMTSLNTNGVSANGPTAAFIMGRTTIQGNVSGLVQTNGGQVFSFGNNQLSNSGTFNGTTPVQ